MTLPLKRKTRIILIIAIPMAVLIAVYCGISLSASRSDMILLSDLNGLSAGCREELERYFEREGRYPENLDVLIPAILKKCYTTSVPEKPKILEMLSHFKYSSDGTTYKMIMSYVTKRGTVYTHKGYGRNGIREKYEFYINGQRRSVSHPGEGK